jgi:hypothetical protein
MRKLWVDAQIFLIETLQFPHIFYILSLYGYATFDVIEERKKTMKKVFLTLLAVVLVLGLFSAVGYTGYRFGYAQGVQTAANGDTAQPGLRPFDEFGRRGIPNLGDRFERGFGPGGFPMRGFGFFSPLRFLVQIAVLGLLVWFVYWLLTRSGWRLTRTVQTTEPPPQPVETEVKDRNNDLED